MWVKLSPSHFFHFVRTAESVSFILRIVVMNRDFILEPQKYAIIQRDVKKHFSTTARAYFDILSFLLRTIIVFFIRLSEVRGGGLAGPETESTAFLSLVTFDQWYDRAGGGLVGFDHTTQDDRNNFFGSMCVFFHVHSFCFIRTLMVYSL
jgi:hypothetical protein